MEVQLVRMRRRWLREEDESGGDGRMMAGGLSLFFLLFWGGRGVVNSFVNRFSFGSWGGRW